MADVSAQKPTVKQYITDVVRAGNVVFMLFLQNATMCIAQILPVLSSRFSNTSLTNKVSFRMKTLASALPWENIGFVGERITGKLARCVWIRKMHIDKHEEIWSEIAY